MVIITSDWKEEAGNKAESSDIGKFELEVRNKAGDQFMDFCDASNNQTDDHIHGHHHMANIGIK